MEFIAKINSDKCVSFYVSFEDTSWNITESEYFGYNYDNFTLIKTEIRDILVNEQNKLCCYCKKELKFDTSTTIEHIIPQKPQSTCDFSGYHIQCIFPSVFVKTKRDIPNSKLENLPHDISYYNILACCQKCNSERGNIDIKPFVFDIDVKQKFQYDIDGNIFSTEYLNEIEAIGLAGEYYVKNRKIWRQLELELGDNNLPIENEELLIKLKLIVSKFLIEKEDLFYGNLLSSEKAIKDVLLYCYFYNIR